MSPNPYPVFSISEHDKPAQIEMRIKLLIRLYLAHHEQDIALAVVEHINAILAHPKYITDVKTRCQLRCLAKHWHSLTWVDCYKMKNKTTQPQSVPKLELKQIQCL